MSKISPLAFIDPSATIGENCEIGPFCFVDKNVIIGDNNVLMNSVTLLSGTRMGSGNTLFPGAVIGAVPQDLKFKGEDTTVEIGDNNKIRENVTIHRGTASKGKTVVGSNNLIMENAHIAHDCVFGSGIIMGNSTKLAGEVIVDDNAIISAVVLVHQFDIPPFVMAGREPVEYAGLNIIGLRRRGFSRDIIDNITHAYRLIYQCNLTVNEAIEAIRREVPMSKEIEYIVDFVSKSERGIIR